MDKVTLSPDVDGYGFDYAPEYIRAEQNGGAAFFASGVWNAAVQIPVTWRVGAEDYEYLCGIWQTHIDEGCAPFLMDLIVERAHVREYLCRIMPDSFGLSSVSQDTYTVSAMLEVQPTRTDPTVDTWPEDILVT